MMNERDTLCGNQQAPGSDNGRPVLYDRHCQPYIAQGNTSNFCQSNIFQVSSPYQDVNISDLHYLPEHVSRPAFHRTTAHNQPKHPAANHPVSGVRAFHVPLNYQFVHNLPSSSHFYGNVLPVNEHGMRNYSENHPVSGVRAFHVPLNYQFVHNLPSSSHYYGNVVPVNEHGMRNYSDAGLGDLWTESTNGIPGNLYHSGESARPSTSAAHLTNCHFGPWSASMEAPLCWPDYRDYGNPPTMEVEARHNSDTVGLHIDPSMLQSTSSMGQSFLPYSTWLDQQSISNAGGLPWNGPPMMPYSQGSNIQRVPPEHSNSSLPVYPDRSIDHGATNFLHSSPGSVQHPNHHPSQNAPANRPRRNRIYQSDDVPNVTSRHTEPQRNSEAANGPTGNRIYWSQGNSEPANRPTGNRRNRSQGRNLVPDVDFRSLTLSRFVPRTVDHVIILEGYNDENTTDVHSDVDNASYEDLLALTEEIGNASTGLTEEDIIRQLKTSQYSPNAATFNQDHDSCIICQDEYEVNDNLGILECRHQFHLQCLKKWLLLKNVCPLCKSPGLAVHH